MYCENVSAKPERGRARTHALVFSQNVSLIIQYRPWLCYIGYIFPDEPGVIVIGNKANLLTLRFVCYRQFQFPGYLPYPFLGKVT